MHVAYPLIEGAPLIEVCYDKKLHQVTKFFQRKVPTFLAHKTYFVDNLKLVVIYRNMYNIAIRNVNIFESVRTKTHQLDNSKMLHFH